MLKLKRISILKSNERATLCNKSHQSNYASFVSNESTLSFHSNAKKPNAPSKRLARFYGKI